MTIPERVCSSCEPFERETLFREQPNSMYISITVEKLFNYVKGTSNVSYSVQRGMETARRVRFLFSDWLNEIRLLPSTLYTTRSSMIFRKQATCQYFYTIYRWFRRNSSALLIIGKSFITPVIQGLRDSLGLTLFADGSRKICSVQGSIENVIRQTSVKIRENVYVPRGRANEFFDPDNLPPVGIFFLLRFASRV